MTIDATRATNILSEHYALFTQASNDNGLLPDTKISMDDLRAVAENSQGQFPAEVVEAAQFLLSSTAARSFLDVGAGKGDVDGTISREDIDGALVTIEAGGLEQALLDTAAGRGGADGYVGRIDLQAAQTDPGIPQSLKDALQQLPPDLPLQTQLRTVFALRNHADDPLATGQLTTLTGSQAFKDLDESRQAQVLALFGGTNAVSSAARLDLITGGIDLNSAASLERYLLTEARPVDKWRDAMPPSGVPDAQRMDYAIGGPETIEYDFPSGTQPNTTERLAALRYTVEVDGQSIEVIVPRELDTGTYSYPTVEQIAKGLAAQPSASLEATDRVVVNPATPQETDANGNVVDSGADMYAGGGTIGINPHDTSNPREQRDFDFTFLHETAHLVDQPWQIAGLAIEWNLAVQRDSVFSTHYADDRYVPSGGSTIDPSLAVDPGEDFAETYMIYHLVKGTPDEAQMRALMPERFEILDRMYG